MTAGRQSSILFTVFSIVAAMQLFGVEENRSVLATSYSEGWGLMRIRNKLKGYVVFVLPI
jgi:hypothetical protein